ncbi:MAG: competence protein ComEA [Candidatus Hydrogenedentes bacterium]|nr:competence protein ComEA [Candidatus Hydrogenedentota bacterium]
MLSRLMTPKEQLLLFGLALAIGLGAASLYAHDRLAARPVPQADTPVQTLPQSEPLAPPPPNPAPAETLTIVAPPQSPVSVPEPAPVTVAVTGAVKEPGAYTLPAGSRVTDLVTAAQGASENADLSDINLAARLIDTSTLTIPEKPQAESRNNTLVVRARRDAGLRNPPAYTLSGWRTGAATAEPAPSAASAESPPSSTGLIDLNDATQTELESLPGIGPKLAEDIVRYRTTKPFQCVDDLDKVSGIGDKRLEDIRPLVTVGGR